ncbi:benzoate/H(+) symporter BenE family transporter [Halomonas dongshanensis]|uniref:Benzoate/H(+) symporter BenE family transporter n=1 Tax=Halomonas dongshanensis TaxID=2890835 RepID=A0ABT2ECP7_9GAMM|nr:benzoate/H(+) symporter BenE family transporter [Halomonas dongshanensis]MCS2609336.1 benzoate/H(+) symporter BenE family transporter [Halomonas dongshanensis]
MSAVSSPPLVRGSDLLHPVLADLISVIVNYGGTFILVFQAAKVARLVPELTAFWMWSIYIGVGVAVGLLIDILLQFGIGTSGGMSIDSLLAGGLIVTYLVFGRLSTRYAVVGILLLGLGFLLIQDRVDLSELRLELATPVFTMPVFSLNALLSIALPLFLITLTGQYMPGMLVLRNDGFKASANPIVTGTGLGSLLMAPFGSHVFNIAAITAAICTGQESHAEPSKRWISGIAATLVGVFGITLAAVFTAFPATFITTLAGLALLGTIGGSLASAMADIKTREASLITLLATAVSINLLGIGGAFWELVIGLTAYALLYGRLSQRASESTVASASTEGSTH